MTERLEEKWQKRWEDAGIFKAKEDPKKKKFYVLEMLPYPSGSGLHMGHAFNYTIGDIFTRFKRMQGFNVFYPMGYDSFGLPAENAAIKANSHPKEFTEGAIKNFIKQQKLLGLSYDWSRMIEAHKPDYYRWDQWMFLKMLERGLAYKKKAKVNWCPKCNTVLANEQVHDGKCWRHKETEVEEKELEQWFFKITDYAEELYDGIENLKEWPEDIKTMQKNWIGKKKWIDIEYDIADTKKKITVSTTRPDTNFGATFVVISPEHDLLSKEAGLIPEKHRLKVNNYIEKAKTKTEEERINEKNKKTGVFTGLYCINQLTNKKMPLWVADFVLMSVGTGVVVGVPGHDRRDFEFAREYDLPIVRVVVGKDGDKSEITNIKQVQEEEGIMINSGFLDGMNIHDATKKIMDFMEEKGWGKRATRYRLHDWLLSRQRFWGTPIPIIYCKKCGAVPVPEKDLPVVLPDNIKFTSEKNPLTEYEPFLNANCPKCGAEGRRETDTMDTFVNSSWYFLRYCDPKNEKEIFAKSKVDYWNPIDLYIGGKEHACMHLIYFRFYIKFMRDIGLISFDEPAKKLFNQGMLHGPDGFVMSKSRGNVVNPIEMIDKYGTDVLRTYLVSVASADKDFIWSDKGMEGANRFLSKVAFLLEKRAGNMESLTLSKMHRTIKEVTDKIENMQFNKAIMTLQSFTNHLYNLEQTPLECIHTLTQLIAPFAPHLAEEMWERFGYDGFVSAVEWPAYDETKIDEEAEALEDAVDSTRKDILKVMELAKIEQPNKIYLIISPNWKYDFFSKLKDLLEKTRDPKEIIGEIMKTDLKKHGKDIMKIVPSTIKDTSKIPVMILDQNKENNAYSVAVISLKKEFECEMEIVNAEQSNETKAMQASPLKPAIVLK